MIASHPPIHQQKNDNENVNSTVLRPKRYRLHYERRHYFETYSVRIDRTPELRTQHMEEGALNCIAFRRGLSDPDLDSNPKSANHDSSRRHS